MFSDLLDFLAELKDKFFSSRLVILGVIHVLLVIVLILKLYDLQIVHGDEYQSSYISMTEKSVTAPAARGKIFDRNGNLLAYNELSNDVIIYDTGDYTKSVDKNLMIRRLVNVLRENGENVQGEFKIKLNDNGDYEFNTSSVSSKKAFLRDIYGLKSTEELDDKDGKYPSTISASEVIEKEYKYFGLDNTEKEMGSRFTPQELLDIINIRYTMSLTAYKKYESTTVSKGVSDNTKIAILEQQSELLGVDVVESTIRVYNDPVYFSSIIGYTGKVQENQLESLQASDPDYTLNDTVGRIGIEQYMEYDLHGTKGEKRMYVDNVGHITDTISETDSVAGKDVYLTIDRDLQIGIYNLLEKQLAGILKSRIVEVDDPNDENTSATDLRIPVKDAYYQLINNNVLDMDKFSTSDDSNEQEIYQKYEEYHAKVTKTISRELTGLNPRPLKYLDEDINQYMVYIYNKLVAEDVIVADIIDQNSDYWKGWKDDTITMRDFLYAGIADNWLDSSVINVQLQYSAADDIFDALVLYIEDMLENDRSFKKLNYKFMIKNNIISGRDLLMALISQGVITDPDGSRYNTLASNGNEYAYQFLISIISSVEITPAQLALDPCTAGCVITDVNTGEVRALVSYPGYDNNLLSDNMDVAYYNSLLDDQSLPLYNNATQAKKAPGSTFKPITAIAALEEGVVGEYEEITCTGLYDTITPNIKCWVYPNAHGPLTVAGGIENSCNYFFSEMGHRLSMDENGNYSSDFGISRIAKYATYFGLDHKSGVEINETEPNISTFSPEQSAMGQGTHAFANIQLSRYVSTIANKGTVFELSLLDKVTDSEGNLIKDYTPESNTDIPVSEESFNIVQQGMRRVITTGSARQIFSDLEVDIAGKTGTAQESKSRGNHAFFISFAPYSDPEIAVTVNIPYGYSSSNAASIARNVYRYYYGYLTADQISSGGAIDVYDVKIGD